MAVSPAYAEGLANPVLAVYAEAEQLMLARIAHALARGLEAPGWAEEQLLHFQLLQAQLDGTLQVADARATEEIARAMATAYNRGQAGAESDLAQLIARGTSGYRAQLAGVPAVQRLVLEAVDKVTTTHSNVLRAVGDQYRDIVRDSVGQALVGTQTRRHITQQALNRMADAGITGFTDVRGREWSLSSYVEMATRTATARAAVLGNTDRLQAAGQDLVMVSDAPQECAICRPLEGKVLSLSGLARADGVEVWGTLDQAMAAGLFHPNCRHSTALYQPGITRIPGRTADPQGDADRQHLRHLERQLRAAKRRQVVALDPAAQKAAGARVRELQGRIRHHTGTTTAKRQRDREQLPKVKPVPRPREFDKLSDDELDEKLGEQFGSDKPDQGLIDRLSVEMEVRERFVGPATAHYARRNTLLDEGFKGTSDDDIRDQVEQAIASGDPTAGEFVDAAFEELKRRAYSGRSIRLPRVARPKPRALSKAAQRRQLQDEYDLYVESQREALEQATNGNLIRRDRLAEWNQKHGRGQLTMMLEGDVDTAYYYASEEVRRYWEVQPRMTFAQYAAAAGLQDERIQEQARKAGQRLRTAAMRAEERPREEKRRRRR